MRIGVWAYLDNNIGDDLMIKLVVNQFPEHTFLIFSDLSVVKETFSSISNVIIEPKNQLIRELDKLDFFFSIGGSIFNNLNHRIGQINRIRRIMLLRKIKGHGIKLATIGCNLGPYSSSFGKWLTKQELKLSHLVTVRDKESFSLIQSFKCIPNYHYFDDLVFNLPDIFSCKGNESSSGLGITVYRDLKYSEKNMTVYKTLAEICDRYIEKTDLSVRLFAFDSEVENDLAAAHHIFARIRNKNQVSIVPYLGDHSTFLQQMIACSCMIAIRFHGSILSSVLKIPFLPIIYSNKTENFLNDCGYKGRTFKLSDLDVDMLDVEEFVDGIIDERYLFLPDKVINARGHFDQIRKLIDGN